MPQVILGQGWPKPTMLHELVPLFFLFDSLAMLFEPGFKEGGVLHAGGHGYGGDLSVVLEGDLVFGRGGQGDDELWRVRRHWMFEGEREIGV